MTENKSCKSKALYRDTQATRRGKCCKQAMMHNDDDGTYVQRLFSLAICNVLLVALICIFQVVPPTGLELEVRRRFPSFKSLGFVELEKQSIRI